jgi:hypothetical protein
VGVTRAQDTLTLSLCKSRTKWGKPRPSIPSRFLLEMRGETEKAQRLAPAAQEQAEQMNRSEVAASEKAIAKATAKSASRSARARAKGSGKQAAPVVRASAGARGPSVRAKGVKAAASRES